MLPVTVHSSQSPNTGRTRGVHRSILVHPGIGDPETDYQDRGHETADGTDGVSGGVAGFRLRCSPDPDGKDGGGADGGVVHGCC